MPCAKRRQRVGDVRRAELQTMLNRVLASGCSLVVLYSLRLIGSLEVIYASVEIFLNAID